MGAYMVRHALVPDLIVASTARRVAETLELLLPAFKTAPKIVSEPRVCDARSNAVLDLVKEAPRTAHSLLLVGHNPGLAELATLLIASREADTRRPLSPPGGPNPVRAPLARLLLGSGDVATRQRLSEQFPTAGLAVIDFALDEW